MLENTLPLLGEPRIPSWNGEKITAVGKSHIGLVRDSNQDSFCTEESLGLYLVADGMGGRAGGEVASRLAVATITAEFTNQLQTLLENNLQTKRSIIADAINKASLKIYERSLELPQYRGMGTTVTLLWIPPNNEHQIKSSNGAITAIVGHVGDSRCYLFRAGFLYQISDDHSLVNEQIKSGIIKPNDPVINQIRNVITRCVGYQEAEDVDTFTIQLYKGDRFLLCSDGVTGKMNDIEISTIFESPNVSEIPEKLINLANSRGGEDNITAVAVEV